MKRNQEPGPGSILLTAALLSVILTVGVISSGRMAGAASGQDTAASSAEPGSAARFSVHSDLVVVPVTVTAGNGQVVAGLAKEQFSIFEDRVPQVITHFTAEDAPAAIGLVFDTSDSMGPKMAKAREAACAVLRKANPGDEFFLIRFSNTPEMVVGMTRDPEQIRRAVDGLEADGFTALLDALKMAWLEMHKAQHARKAIVLISDGEDNSSHITPSQFRELANENDTTIYTLFIGDSPDSLSLRRNKLTGAGLLDDLARQTGGRMFPVANPKELPDIAARIGSWVRGQYVLGYVPSSQSRTGSYHRIEVKVTKPPGFPKLHPTWRLGYYSPNP